MSAITNIFRRGAVYYYRRRLCWPSGTPCSICISLRTRRLSVARQRAARLADRCETLRRELAMLETARILTDAQRSEMLARQLIIERDALEALHARVVGLSNDDVLPQHHSEELPFQLETMEQVLEEWIRNGPPKPGEFDGLEDYLDAAMGAEVGELDRIYLLGGLRSLDYLWDRVNAGADSALRGIGADRTEINRVEARKALFTAKLHSVRAFRHDLEDPDAALTDNQPMSNVVRLSDSSADPEWPDSHLLDLDHRGWLPEHQAQSARPGQRARQDMATMGVSAPSEWASLTMREMGERYLLAVLHGREESPRRRGKRVKWDKNTVKQFRSTMMLATKSFPHPMVQMTHEDMNQLDLYFDRLPATHHKSSFHKPMTLEEICEEAAEQVRLGEKSDGGIGLTASTTNRHFFFLRVLWGWVRKRVPSMTEIYWDEFYVTDRRDRRSLRDRYTVEQGRELFELPIWTGCKSFHRRFEPGSEIFHDAAYFVPLHSWYMGARETEICARRVDEVRIDHPIPHFHITDNELGRVKNETSRRLVPIHPELIRLGFLDYVRELRNRGEIRLFPDLAANKKGPAEQFYKMLGPGMHKKLPFLTEGMFMHSMRHTVETELCEAGVDRRVRNDLLGHANESEGEGRYAKQSSLTILLEAVRKLPVVTAHLERHPLRLAPKKRGRPANKGNPPRRPTPRPRLVWDADYEGP